MTLTDQQAELVRLGYTSRDPMVVTRRLKGGKENWEVRERYEEFYKETKAPDDDDMFYPTTIGKPDSTFSWGGLEELLAFNTIEGSPPSQFR